MPHRTRLPNLDHKTVLLRVDLNATIENNQPVLSDRFKAHAKTVSEFARAGARVLILAHQGRKGDPDFTTLAPHAQMLSKLVSKSVQFISWETDWISQCRLIPFGSIALLDNVRSFDDETLEKTPREHAQTPFVRQLAGIADVFVLDAFSVAHRSHASVVGFTPLLPSFAGPVLQQELDALHKMNRVATHRLLVLGGAKPKDTLAMLAYFLDSGKADRALVAGVCGELLLKASGVSFGQKDYFLQEKGFLSLVPPAKELLSRHGPNIVLPIDFAYPDARKKRMEKKRSELPVSAPVLDIGKETIALFCAEIKKARFIVFNGTMGVFEQAGFEIGTKKIASAIARNKSFSLIGGGDTLTALSKLGFAHNRFGHVSLAGKALLEYLAGKTLPGIAALPHGNSAPELSKAEI